MHLPPPRSHFSLSLKTNSSFGLIFYVSDVQEDNFMALFLAHGKLVYTFNVADQRVRIRSEEKYNDGAWHNVSSLNLYAHMGACMLSYVSTIFTVTTCPLLLLKVIFIHDGSMGRLIIDGLTVLDGRAQGSDVSWRVSSPIYVGGVPPGRAQKNVPVCVKCLHYVPPGIVHLFQQGSVVSVRVRLLWPYQKWLSQHFTANIWKYKCKTYAHWDLHIAVFTLIDSAPATSLTPFS